jgi:restriction system protein
MMLTEMPTYDELMHPLLLVLAKQTEPMKAKEVRELLMEHIQLPPELREQPLPNSGQSMIANRVGWAHDRLKRMGWSTCPSRGRWQISNEGRQLLSRHPNNFSGEMRTAVANLNYTENEEMEGTQTKEIRLSPEEQIDEALRSIRESISEELLSEIMGREPIFFERLVIDLLRKMGYGIGEGVHTAHSHDEGIDGIISLDVLGLQKVYLQAKRYARDNSIGRPALQAFVGALSVQDTQMGVFITTSCFTKGAKDYAQRLNQPLVLIDGGQRALTEPFGTFTFVL